MCNVHKNISKILSSAAWPIGLGLSTILK